MRFDMWKSKAQRGAFLVFTALMIPIIFICAGFAVDLGNGWAYKSKLQNAADAAALAGAAHFTDGDTYDSHPNADSYADQYLNANFGYLPNPIQNLKKQAQEATETNSQTGKQETHGYYRVAFSEKVPTTFMRMFNYDGLNVGVDAVAQIPRQGGKSKGNFINVGSRIWGSAFTTGNDYNMDNPVSGPFFYPDSKIVINSNKDYDAIHHKPSWNPWAENGYYRTFWPEAKGKKRKEAIDNGYFNWPIEGDETEYKKECEAANSEFESMFSSVHVFEPRSYAYSVKINDNIADKYVLESTKEDILDIYFSDYSSGSNQDRPLYIGIKGNISRIHVYLESDITRPVILYYVGHPPGMDQWWYWGDGMTHIEFHNYGTYDFRGSIYTPYSYLEPFDFEHGTFRGSITAEEIEFQSQDGYFKWESFGTPADIGGDSSGSGSGLQTDKLRLVINDNLKW